MINLTKMKETYVVVWYAKNGHFKEAKTFSNGLRAKKYVEQMARNSEKELLFRINDKYNTLYKGTGLKVIM